MKTYVLDILNRIKRKSEELDAKTVLCNTPWKIFNDDGAEEAIHFRENGTLLVVINGRTTSGTWEIFVEDRSVHIMYDGQKNGIMLKPAFKADGVLAMQLDGTEQYAFLVDKNDKSFNKIKSLTDLNNFYKQIEQKNEQQLLKETEEKKKKEEAERIKREAEILEKERLRKLEEERVKKNEYLNKCLKERAELSRNFSNANRIFDARNYSVEEMVYEINNLYEDKDFLKFMNLRKKYPDYQSSYVSEGFDINYIFLAVLLFFEFSPAIAAFIRLIIDFIEGNSDWIETLIFLLGAIVFGALLILLGGFETITEIRDNKRELYLQENEKCYKWFYDIISQDELLCKEEEVSEDVKLYHIVEKYREMVNKRQCLIYR